MASDGTRKPHKWFSSPNRSSELTTLHPQLSSKVNYKPSSPSSTTPSSSLSPRLKAIAGDHGREGEELMHVFRYFDSNGDGKISAFELRAYFGSMGEHLSHEDAQGVIKDLDGDGDDMIDFEDFVRLMKRGSVGGGLKEDLKRAFEMFEIEKGSGCITPRGLQRTLSRLGDEKSYDECVAMIRVFDVDGDGVLSFNEFHQMMT